MIPLIALSVMSLAVNAVEPPVVTAPTHAGEFRHGAVAADHEIASRAGAEMLAKGGNAVDAAVAASFTLSVVRPFSCGIGGGGFMVIHLEKHPRFGTTDIALNYREQTPAAIGPDFYERLAKDKPERKSPSTRGGTAVAIPGTVAGLLHALETYGTLDRATVLAPAIRAAEEGFAIDAAYVGAIKEDVLPVFEREPELRTRFAFVWDRFAKRGELHVGDTVTLPEQSKALRLIAERGLDGFRNGPLGEAIIASISRDNGVMTASDLASFRVDTLKPMETRWRSQRIVTMPPPSSGGIVLSQVLLTLAARETPLATIPHNSADYVHLITEASKHAFADRARWLGDPAFVDLPIAKLLDPAMLAARSRTIRMDAVNPPESYGWTGDQLPADGGTSHVSVVDAKGNAVACTETINLIFGSWLAVDGYGFCLNNEMDDFLTVRGASNAFGLTQSDANLPAPGKRPLSSMTPTIVLEDVEGTPRVRAVVGGSGGPRIISGTLQSLLAATVYGMDAGRAIAAPRFHHQWKPNDLMLEVGLAPVGDDLTRRGHHTVRKPAGWGVAAVQMITLDSEGVATAASDPRKGGRPAGPAAAKP